MTLDLSNPEHREALVLGATLLTRHPSTPITFALASEVSAEVCNRGVSTTLLKHALAALSSPTESAAIVRALLEGCDLDVCDYGCDEADVRVYLVGVYGEEGTKTGDRVGCWIVGETYPLPKPDVSALILCLLSATTREEALVALRDAAR